MQLIELMDKARPLLELYKDQSVEKMLSDLYRRASEPDKPKSAVKKTADLDVAGIVAGLKAMDSDAMGEYLQKYTKPQLKEIGAGLNLKLSMGDIKNRMVMTIVSHFAYGEVRRQMAERPPAENNPLYRG